MADIGPFTMGHSGRVRRLGTWPWMIGLESGSGRWARCAVITGSTTSPQFKQRAQQNGPSLVKDSVELRQPLHRGHRFICFFLATARGTHDRVMSRSHASEEPPRYCPSCQPFA